MTTLADILKSATTLTFDCYGTLIDWETGLRAALREVFAGLPEEKAHDVFTAYMEEEAAVEAGPYRPYREVLTLAAQRVARRFAVDLPRGSAERVPESLPEWKPFPDTGDALVTLQQRFHIGVLSNIDRDLFTATARHFPIAFDFVVTAQDVGSYKPAHGHWRRLFDAHARPGEVVHVAQSLVHDAAPAAELGIPCVWINRRGERSATPPSVVATFPDMRSFAEAATLRIANAQ